MNLITPHPLVHSRVRRHAGPCTARPRWFRLVRARVVQAAVLIGFWKAGAWVVETTGAPVPGAVMGLCFVLALLGSGLLPVRAIQHGAKWLMGEMLLFFVPPLLALLDFPQFFGALGLKLLVAIAVSTLAVMLAIALTIDLCCRVPRVQRAHALTRARRARVRE